MTSSDDDLRRLLARELKAEAARFTPAEDGLSRIRGRVRSRPSFPLWGGLRVDAERYGYRLRYVAAEALAWLFSLARRGWQVPSGRFKTTPASQVTTAPDTLAAAGVSAQARHFGAGAVSGLRVTYQRVGTVGLRLIVAFAAVCLFAGTAFAVPGFRNAIGSIASSSSSGTGTGGGTGGGRAAGRAAGRAMARARALALALARADRSRALRGASPLARAARESTRPARRRRRRALIRPRPSPRRARRRRVQSRPFPRSRRRPRPRPHRASHRPRRRRRRRRPARPTRRRPPPGRFPGPARAARRPRACTSRPGRAPARPHRCLLQRSRPFRLGDQAAVRGVSVGALGAVTRPAEPDHEARLLGDGVAHGHLLR